MSDVRAARGGQASLFRPLPDEIDLRSSDYMPLYMKRLKESRTWLKAKSNPALGFYSINAWMFAVVQRPAASIEDDDDVLAHACECHPKDWPGVKAKVLRGWTLLGGRWHHPVVAEIALEMWMARLQGRYDAMLGGERQRRKRAKDRGDELPLFTAKFETWLKDQFPQTWAYLHPDAGEVSSSGGEMEVKPLAGQGGEAISSDALSRVTGDDVTRDVTVTEGDVTRDFGPKVKGSKEEQVSPPLLPPPQAVDRPRAQGPPEREAEGGTRGHGRGGGAASRDAEMLRLQGAFGDQLLAKLMPVCVRGIGHEGRLKPVDFVATFWGARVEHDSGGSGRRTIVFPSDIERARMERAVRVIEAAFGAEVEGGMIEARRAV